MGIVEAPGHLPTHLVDQLAYRGAFPFLALPHWGATLSSRANERERRTILTACCGREPDTEGTAFDPDDGEGYPGDGGALRHPNTAALDDEAIAGGAVDGGQPLM